MHDTVPALFQEAVAHHEDKPALRIRRDGEWVGYSYRELADAVEEFARGLVTLGLEPGDRVGILAPNSPTWQIADLGALHAGAVTVPAYWAGRHEDACAVLREGTPRFLVVHDADRLAALVATDADALASVEHVVLLDASPTRAAPPAHALAHPLADVLSGGRAHADAAPDWFDEAWRAVRPDHVATIVHGSGALGEGRGAMLTHGALSYCAQQARDLLNLTRHDVTVMFLPLAHVFERIAELTGLAAGVTGHYAASSATLLPDVRDVHPTVLYAVPRVFESLRDAIMREVAASSSTHRRFFEWALEIGDKAAHYRERGWFVPPWLGVEESVARAVAFRDLRQRLGGRLRFFVSGGGPLSADVARFFFAAGVPVYEGYGTPEAGPIVALNWPLCYRLGSVGKPLPGTDVRITRDGELLARGPGRMVGYWNDADATKHVVDADGWLHTGELADVDEEGFLHVHGRKRHVITLEGGARVAPVPVEKRLEESPLVEQAAVFGDGRACLVAVIVPDAERLRRDLEWRDATREELAAHPAVRMILEEEVRVANEGRPRVEHVRGFILRAEPFTVEAGGLTPTMKLRRDVVRAACSEDLERAFATADPPEKA